MEEILKNRILSAIFSKKFERLKTGLDKVTSQHFKLIREQEFDTIIRKVNNYSYSFTRLKSFERSGREIYIPTIRDNICLHALKYSLERKLRVSYANRDSIIDLLLKKFLIGQRVFIIRIDISDFFNSIPHNFLLEKLKNINTLTNTEYYLVKEFLKLRKSTGVPTGIPLSSLLSEFYLKDLDRQIRVSIPTIGNYFRYVDDILIVLNEPVYDSDRIDSFFDELERLLSNHGLKTNKFKEDWANFDFGINKKDEFSYLGYKFAKDHNDLKIELSIEKEVEVKGKIRFCFDEYSKNSNFELLQERLRYLTRINTLVTKRIKIDRRSRIYDDIKLVKYGLVETYSKVNECVWNELDEFLRCQIHEVFSSKIYSDRKLRDKLFKHSFHESFLKKHTNKFHQYDNNDLKKIIIIITNHLPKYNTSKLDSLNRNKLEKEYRKILKV